MYTLTCYSSKISVDEYLENYVDIPTFAKACQACPNYNHSWSCPPYDFDVTGYWKRFKTLKLFAHKLTMDPAYLERSYSPEELKELINRIFSEGRGNLSAKVFAMEKDYPGSVSLAAGGSCPKCQGHCSRLDGKPCRFPETLRHSIEALGGNVGLTIEKLMGLKLEWIEEGRLPSHFILVNGLLIP